MPFLRCSCTAATNRTSENNHHVLLSIFFIIMTAIVSNNAMVLPPSQRNHQRDIKSELSDIIHSPHIGYIGNTTTEIFIIGTSHFSCNSASEVTTLISAVKPDGVVLELDPERCLRLTKQSFGIDATGRVTASTRTGSQVEVLFGADFVAAINACQELDIPLFLGDEYTQETRGRLVRRIWELGAYSPQSLIQSLFPKRAHSKKGSVFAQSRIDVVQTFLRDPRKLTPLVVTTSPPFMVASAFSFLNEQQSAVAFDDSGTMSLLFDASLSNSIEISIAVMTSFLLSCFLFNNIIVERDIILASSTVRALNVLRSLKEHRSIRKRWTFKTTTQCQQKTATESSPSSQKEEMSKVHSEKRLVLNEIPLFTLKTPIEKGMIRRLNLFEPRWQKMMDQLKLSSSPSQKLQLGCVRCTNKFYSATSIDGVEGRYADIIFEIVGNLSEVLEIKEDRRPVSGDRRLNVILRGGDSFVLDESRLSLCEDGYMVASTAEPFFLEDQGALHTAHDKTLNDVVRIVVVVGLLHGNGVVSSLSEMS